MPRNDHWRRPSTKALRDLYDAGVRAAKDGTPCPYDAPRHGNSTRAHIWRQGFEDETEKIGVEALV